MRTTGLCFLTLTTWIAWSGLLPGQEKSPPMGLKGLSNEEAWKLLPWKNPPLPSWARVLAGPLPKTTGTMLELDYLHRAKNPLEASLAAKLRWMTAHSLGSVYGERYAEADLRRCGLRDDDLKKLAGDLRKLPAPERAALRFARKMSKSASTVTDHEMAELLDLFGPEQTVAIVHALAYANFHNRIIMALGVTVEPEGPLPPLDPQLDAAQRAKIVSPRRPPIEESDVPMPAPSAFRPDWNKQSFDDLAKALGRQKDRTARIPAVDSSRFAKLPPGARNQSERIVWMNISMGYQPQLTTAWFDCLRAYQSESAFDRVFSNSVFWVITRSNECFY